MTAAEIAAALGGAHHSGRWCRCRCPVHASRGATLALRDGERGMIVHCHAGCPPTDILAELRRCGLLGNVPEHRPAPAVRNVGTANDAIAPPASLRWVPSLRHPDGACEPAMVARVVDVDGRMLGVHRTWLDRDPAGHWHRRDRASLGPIGGGAVRIAEARREFPLVIAEGIESALAASELSGWPAWAALSAGGIGRLALPPEARDIVIACDRDPSGVGERSARIAADRWHAEGRRVRLIIPDRIGADANDLLREVRRAA